MNIFLKSMKMKRFKIDNEMKMGHSKKKSELKKIKI
jgi:hypothetical protein